MNALAYAILGLPEPVQPPPRQRADVLGAPTREQAVALMAVYSFISEALRDVAATDHDLELFDRFTGSIEDLTMAGLVNTELVHLLLGGFPGNPAAQRAWLAERESTMRASLKHVLGHHFMAHSGGAYIDRTDHAAVVMDYLMQQGCRPDA